MSEHRFMWRLYGSCLAVAIILWIIATLWLKYIGV